MIQKEHDELDKIFVDENEPLDRAILAKILQGYVTIDTKGIIKYSDEYDLLVGHKKVLIYLCCKKAMVARRIVGKIESASQSEVSKEAQVSLDIARNSLHKKYKKILKKEGKGYLIPNYSLKKVMNLLCDKDDNNQKTE